MPTSNPPLGGGGGLGGSGASEFDPNFTYRDLVKPALTAAFSAIDGLAQEGAKPTQVDVTTPTLYTVIASVNPDWPSADNTINTYASTHALFIPAKDKIAAEAQLEDFIDQVTHAVRLAGDLGIGATVSFSKISVLDIAAVGARPYTVLLWTSQVEISYEEDDIYA